jgi:hypothetical protein
MPEGIDALGDEEPRPAAGEPIDVETTPVESDKEREMRVLRLLVARALDVLPNAFALRYHDKRFALSVEERELGADAWLAAIEALFPDLAKLSKLLAVLAAGLWTWSVVQSRMILIGELKRQAMQERRRRAADAGGGAAAAGPGGPPPDAGSPDEPPPTETEGPHEDEPEPWHRGVVS